MTPLLSFDEFDEYVHDVAWCPSNPSVFAAIDGSGTLSIYHLAQNTEVIPIYFNL